MGAKEKEDLRTSMTVFNTLRIASFSVGELPVKNMEEEKGLAVGQIRTLHRKIKGAVNKEDYEKAARIQNTIKEWAKKLGIKQ